MAVIARVVFVTCCVALSGSAAPASAGALGGLSGAVGPVMTVAASGPGFLVSDAEPRDRADSAQAPVAGESHAATPEPPSPEQARRQKLDDLFTRLAASTDVSETNGLVLAIDRLQLESGSSAGDLLMTRAIAAMGARNLDTSLALLDKIIILQPDWAEAWNKRATARYLAGDDEGSMTDIAHVLVLEPRHFGALSGMGMILERRGFRDEALRAYQRALDVAPQLPSVQAAVGRLKAAVAGQRL